MPRTIADLFMGTGEEATSPIRPKVTLSSDSILHLLPRDARKVLVQQVQMMQILESRPVMLMMPYVISVR